MVMRVLLIQFGRVGVLVAEGTLVWGHKVGLAQPGSHDAHTDALTPSQCTGHQAIKLTVSPQLGQLIFVIHHGNIQGR